MHYFHKYIRVSAELHGEKQIFSDVNIINFFSNIYNVNEYIGCFENSIRLTLNNKWRDIIFKIL